ncbi:hypothetical protein ACNF40_01070 [Cuniculiplasma sp. SKW4]|uniref:hypothetical protein n=1 Tax=Cuniculiplasma sp. SKW4 TaxID=3400171 RepID=UPI003FD47F27
MNKKNKKIIAILVASIILISYVTYSEILSYDRSARVEPKMLKEKQMLDIFGFHNYTIWWYRNSSNFSITSEYAFAGTYLQLFTNSSTYPHLQCFFAICDTLYIFKNKTNPFSDYKDHGYLAWYFPIFETHYEVNGSINFTFYIPKILPNPLCKPSRLGNMLSPPEVFLAALNFTPNSGYKLIIFNVPAFFPQNMSKKFTFYAGIAENIFLSVKGLSYESVKQQEGFFI